MRPTLPTPPELALPVASLTALRQALLEEVGDDGAARALQRAGFAAGDAFFDLIARAAGGDAAQPAHIAESLFWRRLSELFAARGWGRLAHEAVHAGVGALDSSDWIEAETAQAAQRPNCFFTTGLLANLLGRTAGADVAVMEVECRARGDLRCRFLFGGASALEALYADLAAGRDLEASLAALR
ncbi:MAG: hypothetical protein HY561_00705 [Gemmatimonadetes bacterium]|nr:hypothetical protein [Gemmatimonadota bacterium]